MTPRFDLTALLDIGVDLLFNIGPEVIQRM